MLLTILVFLLILTVLVVVHELGHYVTAKRLGVKVEEFGFGFPPRVWGKKVGETLYSINLLPIGGFVKLFGEDEAGAGRVELSNNKRKVTKKADEKRAFYARPAWQRAWIVFAGVVMNTLLSIVIFYIFLALSNFTTTLPLLGDFRFIGVHQVNKVDNRILVDEISAKSPAAEAGMVAPLQLLAINGQKLTNADQVLQLVEGNEGKKITITWQEIKSQKKETAEVTPRVHPPQGQGAVGIRFAPYAIPTAILTYQTVPEKIFSGIIHPVNLLLYTFDTMGKLISISIHQKNFAPVSDSVSGPVGVASAVGQELQQPTMKERILGLLNLSGLLSISLAFFNVLPIPALDGGRLFFILIEGFTGRKLNARVENYINAIGMLVLLALIVLITFKDVMQLFSGQIPLP